MVFLLFNKTYIYVQSILYNAEYSTFNDTKWFKWRLYYLNVYFTIP